MSLVKQRINVEKIFKKRQVSYCVNFQGLYTFYVPLFHVVLFSLKTTDHLVNLVKDTDISIISEEIFSHDPLTRIQNLKVSGY